MNKYYMVGVISLILALILFLFDFFDTTIGKIIFGVSVGAGIKFVTDGVLYNADLKKR